MSGLVLAVVLLVAAIATSLAILALPWLPSDGPGALALASFLLGMILARGLIRRRPSLATWLLFIAALLIFPFGVIYRAFGQIDMMSILFHINAGTAGISPWILKNEILAVGLSLLVITASAHVLGQMHHLRRLPALLAVGLVVANPLIFYLVGRWTSSPPEVDLRAELVEPEPSLVHPAAAREPPPDILHIYLEGTDRRFLAIAPESEGARILRRIEARGISLSGVRQVAGTGWSAAGIVASQCGVPLMPRGRLKKDFSARVTTTFMPGVTCLGDLLKARGYRLHFVMGAGAEFAGTTFFRSHGYSGIDTMENFTAEFPPEEREAATVDGFLDDQMVFDLALRRFRAALAEPELFSFLVETMGPHGVPSYLSRRCTTSGRAERVRQIGPAIDCLMQLTETFMAEAEAAHAASGRGRGLRIIVQSDHLNHGRAALPDLPDDERNFVVMIDERRAGERVTTEGSMLDVFPSLLDWLGLGGGATRAGLGRSLFAPEAGPTLVVRYGPAPLDATLWQSFDLFETLWRGSR